jgi:hypothetical protein
MSSQSAAGTSPTIEATLNAILCHLDAIEVKMEPLQPLQDQVTALETAVQDLGGSTSSRGVECPERRAPATSATPATRGR